MKIRLITAVAVLVSATVHLHLWNTGVRYLQLIGPLFIVNVVAGVVIALALLVWRHWIPLLLAFGFGACTLGAFVLSATVGLDGLHEHWVGGSVWTAAASEVVAMLGALAASRREGGRPEVSFSRRA